MVRERSQMEGSGLSAALAEAQNIVEAARKRAAELLDHAARELENARERGYREGFAQGQEEASAHAVRLIEESTSIGDHLAEEAARLAVAICRQLIGEEVKSNPELVQNMARRALQEAVIGDFVSIYINPEDRQTLAEVEDELRRIAGGIKVGLESDPSIERGGCLIRTDFGEVDATIPSLLRVIAARLGVGTV